MTAEQRLRFATDELERANRDAETKRLAWLVARVAHPAVLDVDAALEYAEAANLAAEAQKCFDEAQVEALAEWAERERVMQVVRRAEAGSLQAGTPAFARRATAETPDLQAPGVVARLHERHIARED